MSDRNRLRRIRENSWILERVEVVPGKNPGRIQISIWMENADLEDSVKESFWKQYHSKELEISYSMNKVTFKVHSLVAMRVFFVHGLEEKLQALSNSWNTEKGVALKQLRLRQQQLQVFVNSFEALREAGFFKETKDRANFEGADGVRFYSRYTERQEALLKSFFMVAPSKLPEWHLSNDVKVVFSTSWWDVIAPTWADIERELA